MPRFARFAWALLGYEVLVVAWGAFVRATGSGAGCGRHWPLCNGEVVPHAARVETWIELSHRASSGVAFALAAVLFFWARRAYPGRHRVRRAAAVTLLLMAGEALIGAGLVLFELVAHDTSMKRALSMSLHLVNTFLLLAATTLTASWAAGREAPRLRGQRNLCFAMAVPMSAMLLVGATGAVAALGDTLFPSSSLATGFARDFAPSSHLLLRLRILHPMLATATAVAVVVATGLVRTMRPAPAVQALSRLAGGLAVAQVGAGLVDAATGAPVWMQLLHLVLADATWVSLVLTAAAALAGGVNAVVAQPSGPFGREDQGPRGDVARADGSAGAG